MQTVLGEFGRESEWPLIDKSKLPRFEHIRASNALSLVFEYSAWTNLNAVMAWCVLTLRRFPSTDSFEM
jgi:hypothetical protein